MNIKEVAQDILDNYITVVCNYGEDYDETVNEPIIKEWKNVINSFGTGVSDEEMNELYVADYMSKGV